MRPLKLTMTAFGPYKDKETVDFTRLGDYRLFVISGNTGAGKTTIFDAICYALYDSASGEDRSETRLLRSHFADDQTPTTVEFEFAAGRRTFAVLRQLAYRKSGNKNETPPRAELYETTSGKREPCVDRFVINDINQKLLSIVGLTKEQFSQIVMLPQGEFRKLLTSDTENKEEVLRRIFRTELFQKVEERFNELRRGSREQLDRVKAELDSAIRQLPALLQLREDGELSRTLAQEHRNVAQLLSGLDAELDYIGQLRDEAEGGRAVLDREAAALTERYHLAEALNGQFAELANLHDQKRTLDGRLPEIEAEQNRAALAERALAIEPYEVQRIRLTLQGDFADDRASADQIRYRPFLKRLGIRPQEVTTCGAPSGGQFAFTFLILTAVSPRKGFLYADSIFTHICFKSNSAEATFPPQCVRTPFETVKHALKPCLI